MVEVSTSLLSVERDNIMKTIYNLEVAKTDYFHIDVMDGKFVNNFTNEIMEEYCGYIKSVSTIPLDVHLMVKNVKKYIDIYLNYEPNIITIHYEAVKKEDELLDLISYIKEHNCKVGIAINPDTDIKKIYKLLPFVHLVLIMTVYPGEGGQELIKSSEAKVKELKEYIEINNLDMFIEVDGGIKQENCDILKDAGADIIVSGTGIIKQDNYASVIENMKR
jgi:ribulose-phosphate 3-epimerase